MRALAKRSASDGRRGSPKRKVEESWLRPLCNPLVLKTESPARDYCTSWSNCGGINVINARLSKQNSHWGIHAE